MSLATQLQVFDLAIASVEELKRLTTTDPKQAQLVLKHAWRSHALEYHGLVLESPREGQCKVAPLVALLLLAAYFDESGDWDRMVKNLGMKRAELLTTP